MREMRLWKIIERIAVVVILIMGIVVSCRAQGGPFAYVTNQSSNTVTVIDTSTNTLVTNISLCSDCGPQPAGLAVTPDGSRVYVANQGNGTVSVIATSTNTVAATITIPGICDCSPTPVGVAITPDGTRAYVTDNRQGAVHVIDTNPVDDNYNTVTKSITAANIVSPFGIAITPDGTYVYATEFLPNTVGPTTTVNMISTATNAFAASITVGNNPTGIAVSPNGVSVYVTNNGGSTVSVFAADNVNPAVANITVGTGPYSVALTPNSAFAYVVNQGDGTVSVINTTTNSVVGTPIQLCSTLFQIAITPDGTEAYVADEECSSLDVISTSSNTVTTSVTDEGGPFGVAIGGTGIETATLNGSAQTITFPFFNNGASISYTVPAGWCSNAPCTVNVSAKDTPDSVWQTESANYPGTHIAPVTTLPGGGAVGGDGVVYTVTCTDSHGNVCSSPLDYTTTLQWQTMQANFCGAGPALGKEETTTWENILGSCSNSDATISGNSAPRLSKWAAFYGVTGPSSATVTITTPANGATYVQGESVNANYSCSGTFSECAGTATNGSAINTSSLGIQTFTAEADVTSGPTATASATYTVIAGSVASLSPASLNFGNVPVGEFAFGIVTVKNTGSAPLNIASVRVVSVPGGDSDDFFALRLCPSTLGVGKSCFIVVSFFADADDFMPQSATLTITYNETTGTPQQLVPLTATVVKRK